MSGEERAGAQPGPPPWVRGGLRLRRAVLSSIEAHALECYPKESCGFVLGPAEDWPLLDEAARETNEADRYHAMDPETFPRTGETYFKMNELRASRAMERGAASGRPIKVIYHSHCDAGAYFSEEDAATFAHDGVLMWPCAFLVVSVVQGQLREHALWVHVPGTDGFEPGGLELVD